MDKDFVVVIGRLTPIGCNSATFSGEMEAKTCERVAALLRADGEPICQQVKLERIVPDKKAEAEAEFLDLTKDMK